MLLLFDFTTLATDLKTFPIHSALYWKSQTSTIIPGSHSQDDEKKYHAYYQWVPLVLAFQVTVHYKGFWYPVICPYKLWGRVLLGRIMSLRITTLSTIAFCRGATTDSLTAFSITRHSITRHSITTFSITALSITFK